MMTNQIGNWLLYQGNTLVGELDWTISKELALQAARALGAQLCVTCPPVTPNGPLTVGDVANHDPAGAYTATP